MQQTLVEQLFSAFHCTRCIGSSATLIAYVDIQVIMNLMNRMGLRLEPFLQNVSDSLINPFWVLSDLNDANRTNLSSSYFFTLFPILKLCQNPFWNPDTQYCSYLIFGVTCFNKEIPLGLELGCFLAPSPSDIFLLLP